MIFFHVRISKAEFYLFIIVMCVYVCVYVCMCVSICMNSLIIKQFTLKIRFPSYKMETNSQTIVLFTCFNRDYKWHDLNTNWKEFELKLSEIKDLIFQIGESKPIIWCITLSFVFCISVFVFILKSANGGSIGVCYLLLYWIGLDWIGNPWAGLS